MRKSTVTDNQGEKSKKKRSILTEELYASEVRYRRLFESAKDGILILNAETGKIVDVNPFLIDLLGYTKQNFIEKSVWEIGTFQDIYENKEKFLELQQKEYVRYDDLPLATSDGHKIHVEFVSNVYMANNSKVIQCNICDITERKQAEEKLKNSEERFKLLFDYAPDAYYLTDLKGTFIDGNIAAVKMLGYNKTELIGKNFFKLRLLSPIQLLKATGLIATNLLGKATGPDEFVINHKNGSKITVEISTYPVKIQDQSIVLGIARDITERKQAEKEIAMLAHSLKNISECVSITDLENKILFVNESFLKTYGYELNELIGENISIVRSQSNEQSQLDEILPATIQGEWRGELMNRKKDGTEFPVYLSTKLIKVKENKILGLIGVASDITERKHAETELIKAKERAEESDRLKSAFLANMSHEIRTPMNGILGFVELLRTADLTGEEQQEFIGIIEESGARLLNLINDIINISKIESNQNEITFSDVNINLMIEDIFNFFRLEAENKKLNISFKNDLPANEANIKTDNQKVYAVLTNLVKNAIKFTQTGTIEFGYLKKDGFIEFYVKDSGPGIPEVQKEMIFERFRQGSETLTRNYEGTGLGLSISKAYVEMLGGKIWIENNAKKNSNATSSTFLFTIPVCPPVKVNSVT